MEYERMWTAWLLILDIIDALGSFQKPFYPGLHALLVMQECDVVLFLSVGFRIY